MYLLMPCRSFNARVGSDLYPPKYALTASAPNECLLLVHGQVHARPRRQWVLVLEAYVWF